MAIRFEDDDGSKPAKKAVGGKAAVGGKTFVAEEPSTDGATPETVLPFAKPVRPDKKGRKARAR